ncbi:MAG: hypothetical protein F4W91_20310 [Gemmatimonadetes bacterium]|nr:hypothetical protein [Gemmatimonadota bacterium]
MTKLSRLALFSLALLFAIPSQSSSATGVEIGTLFGGSHISLDGEGITSISLPGSFTPSLPVLYVSWFPGEKVAFGPEFSFGRTSVDGESLSTLVAGAQVAFFLQSNVMSGPYVLGQGSLLLASVEGESDSNFIFGAGMGYQSLVGPAVFRIEGRYRRWVKHGGANEIMFILGLGVRFGADK